MKTPKQLVKEMTGWMNFDVSRSSWFGPSWNALRGLFQESFMKRPIMQGSIINYDFARALYRNQDADRQLGAGFVRPIIDLEVDYVGLPSISGTPDDAWLNECITDHWAAAIQQMFRDCFRDSKVIVRYQQPSLFNPLVTEADRTHGRITVIPPEEVDLTFDPTDDTLVERAAITHEILVDNRTPDEVATGIAPRMVQHELVEIITRDLYQWYDKTNGTWLDTWQVRNTWGFVPLWPVYNEYAADLGGGQSDIEAILTFIEAFHEVLSDTLAAHKYHSIPKVKLNVKNVIQFIKNNWPTAIDESSGKIKDGATISWKGKEIMFFGEDEDAGFIEAQSVLGDSKSLLDFLIECMCIASHTPRWAILAESKAIPETDASVQPFVKKIERKRVDAASTIVMICKMALVANGKTANTPRVSWMPVMVRDLASRGQALQQLVMAFDVASSHQWLSDRTMVQVLGRFLDEVSDPDAEMEAAKDNIVPEIPAPAPLSDTQPAPSNGKASKPAAKKALTTTKASNS